MGQLGDSLKSVLDFAQGGSGQGASHPQLSPLPAATTPAQAPTPGDPLASLYSNGQADDPLGIGMLMPQQTQQTAAPVPPEVNAAAMQDNPYGVNAPNTPQDLSSSTPDQQPDVAPIDVVGDRFQPKHETVLQQIGDYFLGGAFKHKVYNQNLRAAMHGFQDDPENAIKRVDTFDPATAWKMEDQYDQMHGDDAEKAQRTAYMKTENDQRAMQVAAGKMGGIQFSGDPQAAFEKVGPIIKNYLDKHGVDTSDFPTDYDPDKLNSFMLGAVAPKDQIAQKNLNDYRTSRLGQLGEAITNTQSYRAQRLQQLQGGLTEKQKYDQVMEAKGIPKVGHRELSPDRQIMREFQADGQWHVFKKIDGKLQKVGILAPKNEGGSKYDPSAYEDDDDQ